MTFSWYSPVGKTFEARMRSIVERRTKYLEQHPEAADCYVIVARSERQTVGFWLSGVGVPWGTLTRGVMSPGNVGLTEDVDGLEVGA